MPKIKCGALETVASLGPSSLILVFQYALSRKAARSIDFAYYSPFIMSHSPPEAQWVPQYEAQDRLMDKKDVLNSKLVSKHCQRITMRLTRG